MQEMNSNATMPAPIDLACPWSTRLKLRVREFLSLSIGRGIRYSGGYRDWKAAVAASAAGGYAAPDILERVATATSKVIHGEAAYERDSIAFANHQYSWPLMAALLRAALETGGSRLSVLDFGGSLGSSYQQCRPFFPTALDLQWFVVEQEHFVSRGRSEFATEHLHFEHSAAEVCSRSRPDIVLLSGVLQYIEGPSDVLHDLACTSIPYLVIDRAPLSADTDDAFTVQHVPAAIYKATYPCRVFSRRRLVEMLDRHWKIIAEFPSEDGWATAGGRYFRYCGMMLQRRS